MTDIKKYYQYSDNGEVFHTNGRHIINVVKELNELEHYRLHHKKERTRLQEENELLWTFYDGVMAYIQLKRRSYYEW